MSDLNFFRCNGCDKPVSPGKSHECTALDRMAKAFRALTPPVRVEWSRKPNRPPCERDKIYVWEGDSSMRFSEKEYKAFKREVEALLEGNDEGRSN